MFSTKHECIGAVILGVVMALFPAMLQPFTKKITDSDDFALGHFNSIGYLEKI